MSKNQPKTLQKDRPLYQLMELASILRAKDGCPWDIAQTSKTLKPYLVEEVYEVLDAIDSNNQDHIKEELGDLLYQVYAHSEIARGDGYFDIDDVAKSIIDKLVHRHPHVFGDKDVKDKDEVINNWEKIKKRDKQDKESLLSGVPKHLPALLKAYRVQQKVSRVGFDWDVIDDVMKKLDEEVQEFKEALSKKDSAKTEEEIGDILFTLVNISRFLKVNPEDALYQTINKFIDRFKYVEKETIRTGKNLNDMSLEELDKIWEKAKNK